MPAPIERFEAEVIFNPQSQMIEISIPYSDYETLIRRGYHRAEVVLLDDRSLSGRQRRSCYAMLGEIADYMGEEKMEVKEFMKLEFMTSELCETGDRLFSMANAPMSLIAAFQKFLARFIIRHDITTKRPLNSYVDDINDFVYSCLVHKRCAVCGKPADLHHWQRLGMGENREKSNHIGLLAEPLCRIHHGEAHDKGQTEFDKKYHICPVKIDKDIATIWRLNGKRERNDWKEVWFSDSDIPCDE